MKVQWLEKKVNLTLLRKFIEDFFVKRGFKITKKQGSTEWKLLAVSHVGKNSLSVKVNIAGYPNDFTIEFSKKGHEPDFVKAGLITVPFGGGALFLRELKFQQRFNKLENDFWAYSEKKVSDLTGSFVAESH